MRISQFRTFADTLRANGDALAREYLSVLTATEHEFHTEQARFAYADYVRALAMFVHPTAFLAELERAATETVDGTA